MKTIICKSCGKETPKRYDGYCQVCWKYFKYDNYKIFDLPNYGEVKYVDDIYDKQYGMVVCHICGKAFIKLQQHIYYVHHIYIKKITYSLTSFVLFLFSKKSSLPWIIS